MKLIAVYIVLVLIGDAASYVLGRGMEHWLAPSISLSVFLACFFTVFWAAWVLAVRLTKPHPV